MSINNIRRFVYIQPLKLHMNVSYAYFSLLEIANTCTNVTCKMPSSHNKAIRHSYISMADNYKFTFLAAHIKDKDCINYQHTLL